MRLWQLMGWAMLATAGQTAAEPLTTGEWLVDLERDYRLSSPTSGSDVDEEMCLLLIQAACRLEVVPAEAWRAQARLLDLLGRPEAAVEVLGHYLPLAPDDVRARLWHLGLRTSLLQTAEERESFFVEQLKKPGLPAVVSGELHRLLAERHWNRNEMTLAADQARAALKDDPRNLQARQLLAHIEGKSDTPEARVGLELAELELNPGRLDWILPLADELMALGLPDEAITWYRHGMAVIESRPNGQVPIPLLMSLAWALIEQGARELPRVPKESSTTIWVTRPPLAEPAAFKEAAMLTDRALRLDRDQTEPYRARMMMARLRGDAQQEMDQAKIARTIWFKFINHDESGYPQERSEIEENGRIQIKTWTPEVMANFAWFLAHDAVRAGKFDLPGRLKDEKTGETYKGRWTLDPVQQAERAAEAARERDSGLVTAKRVLGSVRRQRGDFPEAESRLREIADQDIWAEIELAELLDATGRREEARQQLASAGRKATTAELRLCLREIWGDWEASTSSGRPSTQPASQPWLQPASPSTVKSIQEASRAFPPAVLDFPLHPDRYLFLRTQMASASPRAGEPWRCVFEVKNTGRFSIPIGPGLMLEPDLLCMVVMRGDRERGEIFSVPLDRSLELPPGMAVSISRTLDVGRVRSGLIGTPQVSHDVVVATLLNPISYPAMSPEDPPIWQPGIGGIRGIPLKLRREPFKVQRDLVRDLLTQTQSPSSGVRITAMEILASLLAESQHLADGRLRYPAQPIDAALVQAAVLARAGDQDWQVRARLAECLRWFVLDRAATQQAAALLNDPHWLVRGLAMRAMAEQKAEQFRSALEVFCTQDSDEWVRRLGQVLLARMAARVAPASTQPAAAVSR